MLNSEEDVCLLPLQPALKPVRLLPLVLKGAENFAFFTSLPASHTPEAVAWENRDHTAKIQYLLNVFEHWRSERHCVSLLTGVIYSLSSYSNFLITFLRK